MKKYKATIVLECPTRAQAKKLSEWLVDAFCDWKRDKETATRGVEITSDEVEPCQKAR